MNYCPDALKLIGKKVICGKDCPMLKSCPRLILEDTVDKGINKAIGALLKLKRSKEDEN